MTEQEFLRQVWRPYDTVEIDGGLKGRVTSVCFPTRSVKATINKDVHDWFKCDMILSHKSATGETTDLEIIENLHFQLMAANKRNEDLQEIKNKLENKLKESKEVKAEQVYANLRKSVNGLAATLVQKKDTIAQIEKAIAKIDENILKLHPADLG